MEKCLAISVVTLMIWLPLCMAASTEAPSQWISCDICAQGFNATHNPHCKYGCDRFLRRSHPKSVTVPTQHTKKGYFWLDCKKCFGHMHKPVDPRCKYGCGHWVSFPPPTQGPSTERSSANRQQQQQQQQQRRQRINRIKNHVMKGTQNDEEIPLSSSSSSSRGLKYQVPFLFIGLLMGVAGTIVGVVLYKRLRGRNKVAEGECGGDGNAIVIYNT